MEVSARANVVFAVVLTIICTTSTSSASEVENPPRRPLLTTSRVIGFPEPPPPFRTRVAFPQLTFDRPVYFAHEPGTDRVVVVEQGGKILAFKVDRDVRQTEQFHQVKGHEAYSITFHPRYAENGYVYVFCNGNPGGHVKDRIFRYQVPHGGRACDPKSERLIIEWDSNGHNGGDLAFGLDGYLYLTSGDGTSDSDGNVTGQDLSDLASAIIRIDVDHPERGKAYAVPKDNPFLKEPGAQPELWAFGLRNPWRMSLDRETGNLWVGDVGQDLWEMIRLVQRGANYGWSVYEGNHPFRLERKLGPGPVVFPVMEHPHAEARSITGGFVYHGSRWPELRGVYVYGDYATGKVWGLRYADGKVTWRQELANTRLAIVGFGHDRAGELYIVDYGGHIHELERVPADTTPSAFPRRLSQTGLFAAVAGHKVQPALIPYSVNAPLWSDGASKERYVALPGNGRITFNEGGPWGFPEQTVLVKTFALDLEGPGRRRVETRLLTLQQGQWYGYSYRWNDQQTDAVLVPAGGSDQEFVVRGGRKQIWHYPSRAECMVCHSRAAGFVLGLHTLQMNKRDEPAHGSGSQLRRFQSLDAFDALPKADHEYRKLANPYDPSADRELRVRSYLHANCAQCHVWAGGGNSAIDLHFNTGREKMGLIGVPPVHDAYGIRDARLVAPGAPERSILYHRLTKAGTGRMPPLSSVVVDEAAAALLADWIRELKPLTLGGKP